MTDHAKALADALRDLIEAISLSDFGYEDFIIEAKIRGDKVLAAYDAHPAEAVRDTRPDCSSFPIIIRPAEAATRENDEDVLEAIDRELSRWACHRSVIEAVKDRARAAISTHQQQGAESELSLGAILEEEIQKLYLSELGTGGLYDAAINAMRRVSRAPQPDTVTLTRELAAEAWDKYWRDPRGDADALFDALTAALNAKGK